MIFEEKYLSCYFLLTDQISLSGCFQFVRYWALYVLKLFINQVVTYVISFEINLIFLVKEFFLQEKISNIFKVGVTFKKISFICFNDNPLK